MIPHAGNDRHEIIMPTFPAVTLKIKNSMDV